jgi:dTDP-D-glucose 4,6-dehydratase
MRKILVTGGAGFIGTNFVYYWLDKYPGDSLVVLDSLTYADKITSELGYEPKESFETGIEKTLDWYLENEIWWRNIMDKTYLEWVNQNYN